MKSTRVQAELNKELLLEAGSKRFREHGFDGIAIADLTKDIGQTHGGFYRNFDSKEHFMAEASAAGYAQMISAWHDAALRLSKESGISAMDGLVHSYLSQTHRDNPEVGCVTAALGAEAARHGPLVRSAITNGVVAMIDLLASMAPGDTPEMRREKAMATFSSLVGAITIARAVDDGDLSCDVLRATAGVLTPSLPKAS